MRSTNTAGLPLRCSGEPWAASAPTRRNSCCAASAPHCSRHPMPVVSDRMRCSSLWSPKTLLVFSCVVFALVAQPRLAAAENARILAVFNLVRGEPAPQWVNELTALFERLAEQNRTLELLSSGEIRRRLRAAGNATLPQAAIIRCGTDLACIAEIGRSIAADQVLLVQLAPAATAGVTVRIIAVARNRSDCATAQTGFDLAGRDRVPPGRGVGGGLRRRCATELGCGRWRSASRRRQRTKFGGRSLVAEARHLPLRRLGACRQQFRNPGDRRRVRRPCEASRRRD